MGAKNCMRIESDNAGTLITPMEACVQDLKNGKWCCSQAHGRPGLISNVKMSKTGKHGHAKFTFNLFFPFINQTSQEMFPGHTHLSRPVMSKKELVVTDYEDGQVTCMAEDGTQVFAFMDPEYVDKQKGVAVGQQFSEAFHTAPENGQEVWVSILDGPVHDKKGDYMIRQIEKFQCKDYD